jgi:O-antigen/teichoic acid export membrane protein
MSRTRSFLFGAFFTYLYQAAVMLVGLWLTPFFIRVLGRHDYGIWLVGLQVLTFLLLADFGIIAVSSRDVARAHGMEISGADKRHLVVWFAQTSKVILCQTLLICIGSVVLFLYGPGITGNLRGPIGVVLLVFALSYPLRIFPAILQGLQDLKFLGQLRLVLWTLSTGLTILMLLWGAHFYALACGWGLQQFGHDLVALVRLRRIRADLFSREVWKEVGPPRWRWITRGFWVSVGQAAYSLVAGTDLLIIASVINPASVVNYSCTGKLVTVLQNQPMVLAAAALPGVAQMRSSEPRDRILRSSMSLAQAVLMLVGAVGCVVLAVNRQFISLWLGPSFFDGMLLTILFVVNLLIRQIDSTLALLLFAFGYEKLSAIRCLLDGLFSVGLAYVLASRLGYIGVILGFIGGATLVAIPFDVYLVKREFDLSVWELSREYTPYLWRMAAVGAVACGIAQVLDKISLVNLAIAGISIGLLYILVILPYALKTPLGGYIRNALPAFLSPKRAELSRSSINP